MGRTVKDVKADGEDAVLDAALEERLRFDIVMARSEEVGGCDGCAADAPKEKFVLCVRAGMPRSNNILLCKFHEGELLKNLLWRYLRRMKGTDTEGFCGPLPKDITPGDPISGT